jgi:hypothetical protein
MHKRDECTSVMDIVATVQQTFWLTLAANMLQSADGKQGQH